MTRKMPGAAGDLAAMHTDIWAAYAALGKATANGGPLTARKRRLVKRALAVRAGSEGAVLSHIRRACLEGFEPDALSQFARLATRPPGLARAVAAKTWIEDIGA